MRKLALLFLLAGCATVRPWEREQLASPAMQFEANPFADEQEASIREITEGATYAGAGSGGGGCGCK
jgi:hypothetical protein